MTRLLIIFMLLFNSVLACGILKKPRKHWVIRASKKIYWVAKKVVVFIVLKRLG